MNQAPPKVSVVMSVYNGSAYLQESVESILNQTYADFEFIIIDDGSSDASWEILQHYASQDCRIKLFQNEQNIGLTKSLNKGLHLAQGDYIARQDADDVSLPQRLDRQVTVLDSAPKVVLLSCSLDLIDADGKVIGKELRQTCNSHLISWYLLFYNYLAGHSQVMFRRQMVLELGGYCEARRYSQDYELWSRLLQVGEIAILPDVLLQQRMHAQRISTEKWADQQALSLAQSQRNMAALIGEEPAIVEVKDLRGLMLIPKYWYAFTDIQLPAQRASAMYTRLRQLHQAFEQRLVQQGSPQPELVQHLQDLIGQQFFCWMQHLSIRQSLWLKLQILFYAWLWSPAYVIRHLIHLSIKPAAKKISPLANQKMS